MNLLRNGLPKPPPASNRRGHIWFAEQRGQSHPSALFTNAEIGYIREALADGYPKPSLARVWNVSLSTISNIGSGKRYRTS